MSGPSSHVPLRVAVVVALAAFAGACRNDPSSTSAPARTTAAPRLQTVALPDLAAAEAGQQLKGCTERLADYTERVFTALHQR